MSEPVETIHRHTDPAAGAQGHRLAFAPWMNRAAGAIAAVVLALGAIGEAIDGVKVLPEFLTNLPFWLKTGAAGALAVVALLNLALEAGAVLERRQTRCLARTAAIPRAGYFRIGPYENCQEDRDRFRRADGAQVRVLTWLENATVLPLYLSGESGAGKSSLLNASVLPGLRDKQWTVVEARAYQDPEAALRKALERALARHDEDAGKSLLGRAAALTGLRGSAPERTKTLRELAEAIVEKSQGPLLLLLDQFEEFLILASPEVRESFRAWVADLGARPVPKLKLLLALRREYLTDLENAGFTAPHLWVNWWEVDCFSLANARRFMADSDLPLAPAELERLVASASELDRLPGKVRPITLNVLGHVLDHAEASRSGLDAGHLVRQYIAEAAGRRGVREYAPAVLDQLVTAQGTKRPRSEAELADATELQPDQVRAVLRGFHEAALARPVDAAAQRWELSHDFIAQAVSAYLGRRPRELGRMAANLAGPALLGGLVALIVSHYALQWWDTRPLVPEMVDIPAGSFCMGSQGEATASADDLQSFIRHKQTQPHQPVPSACPELPPDPEVQPNELPARRVRVPAFRLGRHEVTAGEFRRFVKARQARGRELNWTDDARTVDALPPAERAQKDRLPAVNLSYDDAVAYAEWLSQATGQRYRLPTEAEWEYAARAGTLTRRWWGDDPKHEEACAHANVLDRKALGILKAAGYGITWEAFACETDGYVWSAPVGRYGTQGANGFGLQDLLGNVSEWVADCYHDSYRGAPAGPEAWMDGTECARGRRVIRGGSWYFQPVNLRSGDRYGLTPDLRFNTLGFRLAQDLK